MQCMWCTYTYMQESTHETKWLSLIKMLHAIAFQRPLEMFPILPPVVWPSSLELWNKNSQPNQSCIFNVWKLVTHGWCCQVMLPDWDVVWCPWTTAVYGCLCMSWWLNLQNRFFKQLFLSKGLFCHFWVQALFFEINTQLHKLKVWCSGSCIFLTAPMQSKRFLLSG